MKKLITILGLAAAIMGCGGSGNGNGGGSGADMSGAAAGGGGSGGGGGTAGGGGSGGGGGGTIGDGGATLGCAGYVACLAGCTTSSSQACAQGCRAMTTKSGTTLYRAVQTCQRNACFTHPDGGVEPCGAGLGGGGMGGQSTDMAVSAACTTCEADSIAAAASCSADPVCGTCNSEYEACLADK
jgi:hypothetical protein